MIIGLGRVIEEDSVKEFNEEARSEINDYANKIIEKADLMMALTRQMIAPSGIKEFMEKMDEQEILEKNDLVNVKELIEDLISSSQFSHKDHSISLILNSQNNLPLIRTNLIEFRKILDNLLTNAIKYSPKGSEVIINAKLLKFDDSSLKMTGKYYPNSHSITISDTFSNSNSNGNSKDIIYIEIIDSGIGMSKEDIQKAISGEGAEIDKSAVNKPIDSHGIGMPLAIEAVRKLSSRIKIESQKTFY